jgi:hypothetical protein
MALSADNEDPYAKIIDSAQWMEAKSGKLVAAPEEMTFDYDARTITRRAGTSAETEEAPTAAGLTTQQRQIIQALAREVAAEQGRVQFNEGQWIAALDIINAALMQSLTVNAADVGTELSAEQQGVLNRAVRSIGQTAVTVTA